jgi:hypothetical protein
MKKILKVYLNNNIENKTKRRNKMKLLNNLTLTDIRGKIINTKDVKIKIIQKILNKKSIPKCQDKWNNVYNEEFHWPKIWNNLKRLDISNKIKEFQWKCTHSIIYTESRLRKMNLSNRRCHLCKESNIQEDLLIELSRFWLYLLYHYNWPLAKFLVQILKSVSIYYKVHSD